jgi:phosphatidylserine decarboxylase
MATVWHDAANGIINPPRTGKTKTWNYYEKNITLKQGDEMGRFLLGSTVVMLFEKNILKFNCDWQPAKSIRLGEEMAEKI